MSHLRTVAQVESDLAALRVAADRAGLALACLFSSSDEFEAEVIRTKRAQGAFPAQRQSRVVRSLAGIGLVALLAFAFLMM
jgi:hypothetical protein